MGVEVLLWFKGRWHLLLAFPELCLQGETKLASAVVVQSEAERPAASMIGDWVAGVKKVAQFDSFSRDIILP